MTAISYSTNQKTGYEYGTLYESVRNGEKTRKVYGEHLGRVIDKKRQVFFSRKRKLFQYDSETGKFLPPPPDAVVPKRKSRLKVPPRPVTYPVGDVYLIHKFVEGLGLHPLLAEAFSDKLDSLKAMLCFYMTSGLSNCHACEWLDTSYAKFLFPKAALSSTQVSELLKYLGDPSRRQTFFKAYLRWFADRYQKADVGNILIDSTGLPNSAHFSLTAVSNHNGDINREARLVYVVQQSTGLPIHFRCIPGNIVDVNTIRRTILELKQYGVNTNYAITDAGYLSEENLKVFYEEGISFLTRLQPNRTLYKEVVKKHLPEIKEKGVVVKQKGRLIRVLKTHGYIGKKVDKKGNVIFQGYPAYVYLCVDEQRLALEQLKLVEKVVKGDVPLEKYTQQLESKGVFMLVSKRSIKPEQVVGLYYTRQQIEQVFDFGKNYARMLPLSIQEEETLQGHMLLTFLATIVVKILAGKFEEAGASPVKPALANLATHTCTKFEDLFITSEPNKLANEAYKAAGIEYPISLPACS